MDSKFSKLSYIILICIFLSIHSFSQRASFPQMREREKSPERRRKCPGRKNVPESESDVKHSLLPLH